MCTSNFVDQTRQSLNPIQNLKNLQHPAVALHQAENGLGMRPAAQTAAPSPLQDAIQIDPRRNVFGGTLLGGG